MLNDKQNNWIDKHCIAIEKQIEKKGLESMTEKDWNDIADYIDNCAKQAKLLASSVAEVMIYKLAYYLNAIPEFDDSEQKINFINIVFVRLAERKIRNYFQSRLTITDNDIYKTDDYIIKCSAKCGSLGQEIRIKLMNYRDQLVKESDE